ncbi:MAG: phosphatidylglycerophosphatase A [Pseudomonadales bacterium]
MTRKVFTDPFHFLAFGFGSGLSPKAPGTAGTLVAVPFYFLLVELGWFGYGVALIVLFSVGVYLCHKVEREIGGTDPGGIVFDEFVGLWLTCFLLPPAWYWLPLAIVLFRIFDIVKPWPVSWCDTNVKGGFGIMLDDVVAAAYAFVCIQLGALLMASLS